MQFPAIPTDNLYKLMAIGGLALSAGAVVLVVYGGIFLVNDHSNLLREYHQRRLELHEREQQLADIEILISSNPAEWSESTKNAYQSKLVASKGIVKYLSDEVSGREAGLQKARLSITSTIQTTTAWALPFSVAMFFVGIAGFIFWWAKVQSVQDKILDCEYQKLQKDLAKAT